MTPRQVLSLECAENVEVEKSCSRVFFRPLLDFLLRREPAWFGSARNSPINALSPDKTFLVGEPLVPVRGTKTVLIERNGHRFGLILDSPGAVVVLALPGLSGAKRCGFGSRSSSTFLLVCFCQRFVSRNEVRCGSCAVCA